MKLRLKILAWCHIVFGGLGLAAFAVLIFVAAREPAYADEFAWIGGLFGLASLAYFLPSFFGGLGILRGLPWARAIIWMESALLAMLIPLGTALAGASLWVLLTTREESADGGMAKFERFVQQAVRPIVLALIAMATLGVMIGLGYLFRDVIDPPREQELTPMPSGVPAPMKERPEFKVPDLKEYGLPVAPGR